MFEREIYNLINDGIRDLTAGANGDQSFLRRLFRGIGWEAAEVERLQEFWNSDEGRPQVVHGYPRVGAKLPMFSIVLLSDTNDQDYLGEAAPEYVQSIEDFVREVEAELQTPVEARVFRSTLSYNVYVYAQTPDVCLAYYNVLRALVYGGRDRLRGVGFQDVHFTGAELAPDLRYQGENVFTRSLTVSGWAHSLLANELDLGPLAAGRGTTIAGIHISDHVTGVDPRVTVTDGSGGSGSQ